MKIKILLIITLTFFLGGCKKHEVEVGSKKLNIAKSYTEFSKDSSSVYILNVNDIIYDQGKFFIIIDDLLYSFDDNFQFLNQYGSRGRGPGEYINPNKLAVQGDSIFITDAGQVKLFMYSNKTGNLKKEWNINDRYSTITTFYLNKKHILFSTPLDDNNYLCEFKISSLNEPVIKYKAPKHLNKNNVAENLCHILQINEDIIAVSTTNPIICIYNRNGNLKNEYTLPGYLTESRINFKNKEIKRNSENRQKEYVLFKDVYYNDGRLYLLMCENIGANEEYFSNKIIVLKKDKNDIFQIENVFKLEGESYSSICVNEEFLVGFDTKRQSIDFYKKK